MLGWEGPKMLSEKILGCVKGREMFWRNGLRMGKPKMLGRNGLGCLVGISLDIEK